MSVCLVVALTNAVAAALSGEQRRQIEALDERVTQAARLFLEKKFTESGEIVRQVQQRCEELAADGDADVLAALEQVHARLSKAHALLELEGVSLPPLKKLGAKPSADTEPAMSTGVEGTVSFSADLASMFSEHCGNCHGRGRRPSGRFDLMTFTGLMKGGESGLAVTPDKPEESLLVQRLKGTGDGDRMPLRAPPLPDDAIARVEAWIAEGARFDGPDPDQDLQQVAGLAQSQRSTHEELSAARKELALKNWALGMSGQQAEKAESENFFAIGNVGQATLQNLVDSAEAVVPTIRELFAVAAEGPLVKGRITLVVLAQRYDYTEYGKMVERRELPQPWRGHWQYNVVDAYGALIPPRGDEYSRDALLAQQIAGVYVASLGVPPWFAEGSARWSAYRVDGDDARVKSWESELPEIVKSLSQPDDFLTGKLAQERADIAAFSFVRLLTTDAARFRALLTAVRGGTDFDAAFARAYGGSPSEVARIWVQRAAKTSGASSRNR